MASAIPVYRSHRGSTPDAAPAQAESGQREHLGPVQSVHRLIERVCRAGSGRAGQDHAEDELGQRDDRGRNAGDAGEPGGRGRSGPARGPGQGDRDDGQPGGGQALGEGELCRHHGPVPGERGGDLGSGGGQLGAGRWDG